MILFFCQDKEFISNRVWHNITFKQTIIFPVIHREDEN